MKGQYSSSWKSSVKKIFKLALFDLKDLSRIKWLWLYFIFLFAGNLFFVYLSQDFAKVLLSLLSITLLIVPLIAGFFGITYFYDSRNFIKLLLSQPIKRTELLLGKYLALSLFLSFLFFVGSFVPLVRFISFELILLEVSGIFLTFTFTALSFLIGVVLEEKAKGVSLSLALWLYFALLHDGLILTIIYIFKDYPLEKIVLILTILSPIDLARLIVILNLDVAALMGISGAVFKELLGSFTGILFSLFLLTLWFIVPLYLALLFFRRKDL
ncbi:MAG TPA: hypothetical protein EYP32_05685 [Aquificaceae bacterium]|nr:hypothetical protein [Aquificaceae bacterium]HIQ49349.1 hypothetical protein [Aquifex aeolicus]